MRDIERGYVICQGRRISKGPVTTGDRHSVDILVRCPAGSRPLAIVHNHPSGNLSPSPLDIKTSREHNVPVICVTHGRRAKCYRVLPRARW